MTADNFKSRTYRGPLPSVDLSGLTQEEREAFRARVDRLVEDGLDPQAEAREWARIEALGQSRARKPW
jgi:hypothetical protein